MKKIGEIRAEMMKTAREIQKEKKMKGRMEDGKRKRQETKETTKRT